MHIHRNLMRRPRLIAVVVGVLVILMSLIFVQVLAQQKQAESRARLTARATAVARVLERQLAQSLSPTHTLATLVRQGVGTAGNFTDIAREAVDLGTGIRSLHLAPCGIVQGVYPLAGNEKLIGRQLADVMPAAFTPGTRLESKALTLVGPLVSVDSEPRVIGRLPIFLRGASGAQEIFWGYIVADLSLAEIFSSLDIGDMLGSNIDYELARRDLINGQYITFAGPGLRRDAEPVSVSISVPNSEWLLSVAPSGGWNSTYVLPSTVVLLSLATVIATMMYLLIRQQAQIARLAVHDPLTRLPNRTLFEERAALALASAARHSHLAAFLFVDLDDFKRINDRYGHDCGDDILREVARRLSTSLRAVDTVARLGGDEFVVVITNVSAPGQVASVVDKLYHEVTKPIDLEEFRVNVGVSIGASLYPRDGNSVAELMKMADTAMYAAKHGDSRIR